MPNYIIYKPDESSKYAIAGWITAPQPTTASRLAGLNLNTSVSLLRVVNFRDAMESQIRTAKEVGKIG